LTNRQIPLTYHPVGMNNRREPSEWPETKRRLVDAGVALMRLRGFNATSLDEICSAARVTKGGFFHYFKNKDEMAKAALTQYSETRAKARQSAPFGKLADPLERVYGRLEFEKQFRSASQLTKGCLIGTLAQEVSLTSPKLRSACMDSLQRTAQDFERDLAEAKAAHAPKEDFDPGNLARLFVTIVQGSMIMAKAAGSNAVMVENLEQFRRHLEFLFGRSHKPAGNRTVKSASPRES
jgi:TetR/AcrR family transcriptional regulator, transcriptional repressor for nem operon